jgi:type IV pilus assembly protein PilY1
LRTFLGTGNREQIMQQGAACGPDNLLACCQAGCTLVESKTTKNWGACDSVSTFTCDGGMLRRTTSATTACSAEPVCAPSSSLYEERVTLKWQCPGAGTITDSTAWIRCDGSGLCTDFKPIGTKEITGTFNDPPRNRFYGIWAYGKDPKKTFKTQAEAKAFDDNRFTDVAYTGCSGPAGGTCKLVETTNAKVTYSGTDLLAASTTCEGGGTCTATASDAGWFYEYGRQCPLGRCVEAPPWKDEKTGSGATVVLGCTAWGGFRPFGAATSTDPCSGELGRPATYGYVADHVTGTPGKNCGYPGGGVVARATPRSTTAPPTGSTVRITFNAGGAVSYSALQIDAGAPPTNTSMGVRTEMAEPVYWLEVPRQLHSCRHDVASSCK